MEFDFSSPDVEDVAAVPEGFRSAFVEDPETKKWRISDSYRPYAEAISGLNRALKAERSAHSTVKGQKDVASAVKEVLGSLGIEDLPSARAKIEELTATVASKANVDPAKLRKEIEDTFKGDFDRLNGLNAKMQRRLESHLIGRTAATELAAAKGNPVLLMPHVERQCKVIEDGDDYAVRILDKDGQYRGDGKGGFMGVADLIAEMRKDKAFAPAFESETTNQRQQSQPPRPGPGAVRQGQQPVAADRSPTDRVADGLAARRRAMGR